LQIVATRDRMSLHGATRRSEMDAVLSYETFRIVSAEIVSFSTCVTET
jgi:hypothetical protein